MAELELRFAQGDTVELVNTFFHNPVTGATHTCVRGKSADTAKDAGSFQWTSGVRALSILLLKAKLGLDKPHLSDSDGDLVTSLDNALDKNSLWLTDMFGCNAEGRPYLRRLLKVVNPKRKRPGPIEYSLNEAALDPASIKVSIDSQEVKERDDLKDLLEIIRPKKGVRKREERRPTAVFELDSLFASYTAYSSLPKLWEYLKAERSNFSLPLLRQVRTDELFNLFRTEIQRALSSTDVFSKSSTNEVIRVACSNPSFSRLIGRSKEHLCQMGAGLTQSNFVGVLEDERLLRKALSRSGAPLKIGVSPGHVGTLAIFKLLNLIRGFSIEVNSNFSHSMGIVSGIANGLFEDDLVDAFVVNLPAAASVLNDKRVPYVPLLPMPQVSHYLVGGKPKKASRKTSIGKGVYGFMSDADSTTFHFEGLQRSGILRRKAVDVELLPIDSLTAFFKEGDEERRSILPFPYHFFRKLDSNCFYMPASPSGFGEAGAILFIHKSLAGEPATARCLEVVIRDAWLELKQDGRLVDLMAGLFLESKQYLNFVTRLGGITSLSDLTI